jgi:Zn-dependent protease
MHDIDLFGRVAEAALFFVPFLFALSFHEFAHGWVARLKGDRTAERMGRLTLNPFAHADPVGTILLPIIALVTHIPLFGWAKPVPVDSRNFRNPKNDMFWVAAAGPLSNVLLAVVGAVMLAALFVAAPELLDARASQLAVIRSRSPGLYAGMEMLYAFLQINLVLALFNLIPIHPLDGAKVMARFLPYRANRWLEEHEQMLSMGLLLVVVLGGLAALRVPVGMGVGALDELARGLASLFVAR